MAWKMLDGVDTTGVSPSIKIINGKNHSVQVKFTNSGGSVTVLAVDLEGTINNQGDIDDGTASWFQMAQHTLTAGELSAKIAQFQVVSGPERHVRVNITTLTETGTTTVSVIYDFFEGYLRGT